MDELKKIDVLFIGGVRPIEDIRAAQQAFIFVKNFPFYCCSTSSYEQKCLL